MGIGDQGRGRPHPGERMDRFALYFAPIDGGDLARLGAAWLGRDAARGAVPGADPALPGGRRLADLTVSARRYGLHATLKAPIRLAQGRTRDDLLAAARDWCAGRAPIDLGPLHLVSLGGFLALVPVAQPQALTDFAADLVRDLDAFRAPPSPDELARRRAGGLSARQDALLAEWGYPYVMEEFQFHITLTDRLPPDLEPAVTAAAQTHFGPVLGMPQVIDDLAVFGEAEDGTFHQITRLPLRG